MPSPVLTAMKREASEALDALQEALTEARRVLDANELQHMKGDRHELKARVERFCELSKRYQDND